MFEYEKVSRGKHSNVHKHRSRHSTISKDISQHHLKENDLYVKVGLLRKSPIISSSQATDSIKGLERL